MSVKPLKQEQQAQSAEHQPAPGEFQALLHRPISLAPRTMPEAVQFAELAAKSSMVPKDYIGKSANIFLAVQMGAELGLSPMQALQNIAVVNGRPSLWGDAMLAVVMASAAYEWHDEKADATGATCTVKRKGQEPYSVTFTVEQAKAAGLWAKGGPWSQYPQRMLQMRARGFALRDKFADVLRGLISAEEARDMPPREPPLMEAAQTFAAAEPEAPTPAPAISADQVAQLEACIKDTAEAMGKTAEVVKANLLKKVAQGWGLESLALTEIVEDQFAWAVDQLAAWMPAKKTDAETAEAAA